jgi:phosphopantetheine adenylyltransferase
MVEFPTTALDWGFLRDVLAQIVDNDELYALVQEIGETRVARAVVDAMITSPETYSSARIVERVREDLLNKDLHSPLGIGAFHGAHPSERN